MTNTIITILSTSAVSAALIQFCTWAVKFMGERQTRNATTAQTLTAAASGLVERVEKDNERLRATEERLSAEIQWLRNRLDEVLDALEDHRPELVGTIRRECEKRRDQK